MTKLLPNIHTVPHKGYCAILDDAGQPKLPQPWSGDLVAGIYDWAMESMVFPRQFGGDWETHLSILTDLMADIHDQRVLEVAAGTAHDLPQWLSADNAYVGSDVSASLLKRAARNLRKAGRDVELYLASVDELPFANGQFDICICNLALNFFPDAGAAIDEMHRVLAPSGKLIGCVPVTERIPEGATVRGTLFTTDKLAALFADHGFCFEDMERGDCALVYFAAAALQD